MHPLQNMSWPGGHHEEIPVQKRELNCIICPKGCPVTVTLADGDITRITGFSCPRGEAYARREVTNPMRAVTGTVRVTGGSAPVVSVKTARDIPKSRIPDVAELLRHISVPAPVAAGDVLAADAAGTGVDIIATKSVPARS